MMSNGVSQCVMNMTVAIDKAGRMVIPKAFREHLGWHEGSRLLIEIVDGKFVLHPPATSAKRKKHSSRTAEE